MANDNIIEGEVLIDFPIVKFNPTVEELTNLSNSYKWLSIKWIDDKEWYEIVKRAQLDLRDKRVSITKLGKSMRDGANAYAKNVIEQEKSLVALIEWTEKELETEKKRIDNEIEIEKRKKILPDRKSELERHWINASDDFILSFTSDGFNAFVNAERERILNEKEAKLKKDQEQVIINQRKQKLLEITTLTFPDETILRYSDEEFWLLLEKIIDANKQKEIQIEEAKKQAVINNENKQKQEQLELEKKEKRKQEVLEKEEKYQQWLKENNYNNDDYYVQYLRDKRVLYKKVSEFIIPTDWI